VLPIEKEEGGYRIRFEKNFSFHPDQLQTMTAQVVRQTGISRGFILEVEACAPQEVVYSFEMGDVHHPDILPCKGRDYPRACYSLLISLRGKPVTVVANDQSPVLNTDEVAATNNTTYILMLGGCGTLGLLLVLWWRRRVRRIDPNLVQMGSYRFHILSGKLIHKTESVELTVKEADLLKILLESVNSTVERDVILHRVWGDEGNYIGRTLDVYISKLRKKLEHDPAIKLVNVRGVGYKLLLLDQDSAED
jgi:hypothetical protein